ncbi:RTA1-domain-containing protein [Teratosphaeria nubilosa]|uniref:RTA1-domain-containing protein n=1 Tax=Teratosphaeria nubilosa TaxID=161662 RepID=A0A6G1L2X9_9PEZI|nr:RTA1-domain-containing protein [Teratosphaeria nubilosa]
MPHGYICTEVTPQCPVEATTYGYRPHLAGNIVLLVIFGICTIAQLILGIRYRLRAFTFAVSLGCLGEAIGYGGRLIMNKNPWSDNGFKIQICCLILSPSFLAAGIYLTLKHLVIYFGPEMSRIRPALYTWIFISCDAVSIIAQAAGGGVASAETVTLVNVGDDIMIAGIAFQVATMFVCLCLAIDFGVQVFRKHGHRAARRAELDEAIALPKSFRFYAICCAIAFLTIFIRCIYRIPEMSGGWGSAAQHNEVEFMVLDGGTVAIAAILLTVAHPGIFFPAISSRHSVPRKRHTIPDEKPGF